MNTIWDVIVIGGGASGMMAAVTAASLGRKVLILEKNPTLGKKLRITGGGRCNITNATFVNRQLLARYGEASKFLFSTFAQHSVNDSLNFFHQHNLPTKEEAERRIFPLSEKAEDVALLFESLLQKYQVKVLTDITVSDLIQNTGQIVSVQTNQGIFKGDNFIIATGGTSRPDTGSTGDGYSWLQKLGHTVIYPTPSLVPIVLKDTWVNSVSGLSLNDCPINLYQDQKLFLKTKGKVLFTHQGLSGPSILNISSIIGDGLQHGIVTLKLNLTAQLKEEELNQNLAKLLIENPNKLVKNILSNFIPAALALPVLDVCNLNVNTKANQVTRKDRHALISTVRGLPVEVSRLLGPEKAIIASGGLSLNEVDFKTMASKLYPNLFIIGDLLNINRPSGGYSLQLCWTTGYVAGVSSAQSVSAV
ncbi:MAG TPA: NAD(P)/FAD-dependent oxidoreductase [Candidatus Paceibacterota bacterium]|nr:NAD(P)/FAD-dependent oxidoreductase [Candidatus Paceibacterota bacterium]HMO83132.1 NAD(P)/FAD-dependent oxidoreductase [Candidatus Paceibacterota bacterium]